MKDKNAPTIREMMKIIIRLYILKPCYGCILLSQRTVTQIGCLRRAFFRLVYRQKMRQGTVLAVAKFFTLDTMLYKLTWHFTFLLILEADLPLRKPPNCHIGYPVYSTALLRMHSAISTDCSEDWMSPTGFLPFRISSKNDAFSS